MTSPARPDQWLLIYSDRSDPVSNALFSNPTRFDREIVALSVDQLVNEVEMGADWKWRGRTIDPSRTAVVNRLASLECSMDEGEPASAFEGQLLWIRLRDELLRFAYASALPSVNSSVGGYGTLLDQWLDFPDQFSGLRVPQHETPWDNRPLAGDLYVVNSRNLYSLGRPTSDPAARQGGDLVYVRPRGTLVHVSQVGRTFMIANAPPQISQQQAGYMTSFATAMASLSTSRILEHAFFVGDELPVFYATSPEPILSGRLPMYADLVIQGLHDDFESRSRRASS